MNPYAQTSHDDLVEALLAPAAADPRTGYSPLDARLQMARELLLRNAQRDLASMPVMESPQFVREWLRLYYAGAERETFLVLFLDARHRLLDSQDMFQGTLDGASVYPREVVREALRLNAAAVCVAHNHPSAHASPSAADKALTARLKAALALVEIRLLDHFVVGGSDITSLAEQGLV